jgi:hypothetical protein
MSTAAVMLAIMRASLLLLGLVPALARADGNESASKPEHLAQAFIQYGLAFTGEVVASAGPMCSVAGTSGCILGTGGGLALRVGRRLRSPLYIGAAYEFAKMDSSQLYRLGILQQARAEGRYYVATGYALEPYFMASVGAVAYGNLWGIDTGGPALGLGIGAEIQLSTYLVVGLLVSYRPLFFAQFHDSSQMTPSLPNCSTDPSCHPAGFAHLIGFDLVLETRDPF